MRRNTSEILGKDKVMHTVKKCFAVLNNQPHAKLLILFEWLALLTRDRKNCIRFLKAGMLVKVLNCFRHWQHWKGKGLLKLSKSVISIYTHLARTKSGKKSLVQSDAISMIRAFCEACPQERSFDDVIMRSCAMIHVCYGKETLPLERLECPIKFEVPRTSDILSNSPLLLADSGSSSDEDDPEAEGDDEGSDSDIESESDNSLVDEDEDDQDQADTTPVLENRRPSRKGSLARNDSSSEVESEMMSLDRIAKFSYFFREFSSQYTPEVEGKKSGMSIVNKLEQSSGDCIIEEYEESWTDLRSDDNGNLEEASGGTSNNIPHVLSFPTAAHKYSWTSRHGAKLPRMESLRKLYFRLANKTSHVSPFVKIAYPDICFGLSGKQVENLCATTDRTVLRKKMFNCIAKAVAETVSFRSKIVYSLDELIGKESMSDSQLGKASKLALGNNDEADAGKFDSKSPLSFESRFESGNLRKAVQTGDYEYDLFLTSDINSSRHNQWFYFQVGNVSDEASYTFNIINCIKTNSLFNYGMQPVVFSVMDAMKHKPGWVRSGSQLCYYKNGYKFTGKKSTRTYHTLSFTLSFANKGDIVYIAYYIPFTYTRLMVEVHNLLSTVKHSDKVHCRYDVLCKSLDHNDIPLLTITAPIGGNHSRMQDRDVVFITSRVHPGETNASWVMMGILRKLLLGNNVEDLLQRHVFKIVPMLNAEGVINGCHRSGLTSQDLNRCWMTPHEILHPSIYNTKMLIAYCCRVRGKEPSVFLDLHGHSRRKNAFFYGCSFARSWRQEDRITPENPQKLYALAESMSVHCPYFVMHFCHYDVRKSRETTARVAVWREFGITRSFTLECSYCGCDRGPSKGVSFGTSQLWEIGEALCESIATMECKIQSQQKLNEIDVPEAVIESFIE
ncbi:Cytosolic carboxypeptidase 1 [Orchesella cincta]|uniref:Cytosolic carboxypeptidase 1 n=1 Tax=Orchesella cincta TaxID=48709 RepID=A0A1D2NFC6_ORCCI|nr:Cytosolic carboxypeptidase 1 [Orchesella cincta]